MPTLVMDPAPVELEQLIEHRRRLGLDHRDEVWGGVLHMNPPPSYRHERLSSRLHRLLGPYADAAGLEMVGTVGIGAKDNNRIPDLTLQRPPDAEPQWQQTAALAIEIVSPKDESYEKFAFYAAHHVDEVLIVDPQERSVNWMGLAGGEYRPIDHSAVIDLGPDDLAGQIDWS
jgi:Uma2 family endonuclease